MLDPELQESFKQHLLGTVLDIVVSTVPQFHDNEVHQVRLLALDVVLHCISPSKGLEPHVGRIMSIVMELLEKDNDVIASKALHIIFQLHKQHKQHVKSAAQPFLVFFKGLYKNFHKSVKHNFQQAYVRLDWKAPI